MPRRTPPNRAELRRFFSFGAFIFVLLSKQIVYNQGVLLAAVLGENLALRVALQTTIALIAAPLGGAWIVTRLSAIPAVAGAAEAAVVAIAPSSLEPLLATAATATTLAAATCVAILVPFALSFTDELYVLRAGAKTARALKAARRASVINQADVLAAVGKSD